MHLQITNRLTLALDAFRFNFESAGALELRLTLALDAFRFNFESAGALELPNEYSGLASEAAPILPSQSSGMHVPNA